MKTKIKIIITVFLLSLTSCNDLNEEVFSSFLGENFFETEQQIATQSIGLYNTFKSTQWEWFLFDLVAYPSQYLVTFSPQDIRWKQTIYAIEETNFNGRPNQVWTIAYDAINRANNMIKNIPTSPLMKTKPALMDQYIAEAKCMRAYCYFNLVQLWGNVPIHTEPTEGVGEDVLFRPRADKEKVYDLIIEDLKFASEKLPVAWHNSTRGRMVKSTATLMLGKVYLTSAGLPLQRTENYQKAIDALKPLADNPTAYDVELVADWKSIFSVANEQNKEIVFSLGNTYVEGFGGVMPHITTPRNSPFSASTGSYFTAHPNSLLLLYGTSNTTTTDVRRTDGFIHSYVRTNNGATVTYSPNVNNFYGGNFGICGTKYIDPAATRNTAHSKDIIIYRYVDAFIMLAEAYNEVNDPINALKYLKVARDRVKATVITETNQALLRQIIRNERIREFYDEYTELYDIRRWGTAKENFENHPTRILRAPTAVWNDKFLLYPIPDRQINLNPKLLPNNPGY